MAVYTVFYKSEEAHMLCVIPIILSLAFLSYDLLSALFFHQRNSKELDGGCTYLPTYLTYPG